MKKKYVLGLMSVFILFTLNSSAESFLYNSIDDPSGDNIGPIDLLHAGAEVYERPDNIYHRENLYLLKLSIGTTPRLPGVIIFEADVDNSTGTGGTLSTIGVPVSPCPCKTEPGFDIVVSLFTRRQGDNSSSAIAASCADNQGPCGRRREAGEWYAITSLGGQPVRAIGVLRSYLDPIPKPPSSIETEDCYTIPWSHIIAYANIHQREVSLGNPTNFNYAKARAYDYGNSPWQVSIWYDSTAQTGGDEDDVASGAFPDQTFDLNDYAPNTGKADMVSSGGPTDLTFCEGNFDGDQDVDGSDAGVFKSHFGRSPFWMACPSCCEHY